ncbi:hypothetical protein PUN28_012123 [Cardiocondyla obscurior]|uniref:Uncharacterized protein n=1 Tax=Cardiocondyla obscurior TaxID=286306 RepID=A0AAW2FAU4_9HYME
MTKIIRERFKRRKKIAKNFFFFCNFAKRTFLITERGVSVPLPPPPSSQPPPLPVAPSPLFCMRFLRDCRPARLEKFSETVMQRTSIAFLNERGRGRGQRADQSENIAVSSRSTRNVCKVIDCYM